MFSKINIKPGPKQLYGGQITLQNSIMQRGEKKCDPRQRGRKLEHRAARFQRGGCFCSPFSSFSTQYLRLLSAGLARWKF